jgi:hypothetical protein
MGQSPRQDLPSLDDLHTIQLQSVFGNTRGGRWTGRHTGDTRPTVQAAAAACRWGTREAREWQGSGMEGWPCQPTSASLCECSFAKCDMIFRLVGAGTRGEQTEIRFDWSPLLSFVESIVEDGLAVWRSSRQEASRQLVAQSEGCEAQERNRIHGKRNRLQWPY